MNIGYEPRDYQTHDTLESVFVDVRGVTAAEDLLSLEFGEEGNPKARSIIRLNLVQWEDYKERIERVIEEARRLGCARG